MPSPWAMFTSAPCCMAFRTAARSPFIAASATTGARDDVFGSGRDLARVSCAVACAALSTSAAQNRWVTFIVFFPRESDRERELASAVTKRGVLQPELVHQRQE